MTTEPKHAWRPKQADRAFGVWQDLTRHLDERLAYLRLRLEDQTIDHDATQFLRGQIREVKRLLDLNTDLPDISGT